MIESAIIELIFDEVHVNDFAKEEAESRETRVLPEGCATEEGCKFKVSW